MDKEEWALGTATAHVVREADSITIALRGVVTAMAYEQLHMRLSRETARRRTIEIGAGAMLAATAKSLADAAVRGTPMLQVGLGYQVTLSVPSCRTSWAEVHCLLLADEGLSRRYWVQSPQATGASAAP